MVKKERQDFWEFVVSLNFIVRHHDLSGQRT